LFGKIIPSAFSSAEAGFTDKLPQSSVVKLVKRHPMLYALQTTIANLSHMKVNPNQDLQAAAQVSSATKRPAKLTASAEPDFQASTKLALKLAATPTVRTDELARAKALIADPHYPNPKTVRAIADQLADKIQPPLSSES